MMASTCRRGLCHFFQARFPRTAGWRSGYSTTLLHYIKCSFWVLEEQRRKRIIEKHPWLGRNTRIRTTGNTSVRHSKDVHVLREIGRGLHGCCLTWVVLTPGVAISSTPSFKNIRRGFYVTGETESCKEKQKANHIFLFVRFCLNFCTVLPRFCFEGGCSTCCKRYASSFLCE